MKALAIIFSILFSLVLAGPAQAASATTASLSVTTIERNIVCNGLADRGRITFQSEPDKAGGGPKRHIVNVSILHADGSLSESALAEIDASGVATYCFREAAVAGGDPASFSAFVAQYGTRTVPISPVVTGTLN